MYKILLADEQHLFTIGMSLIIEKAISKATVSVADSFSKFETIQIQQYNMLLFSLPIDSLSKMEKLMLIAKKHPKLAILFFAENTKTLPLAYLYKSGIHAVLDKNETIVETQKAITEIYHGNIYVNDKTVRNIVRPSREKILGKQFSPKEKIIAKLLLKGKRNVEICTLLKLSTSTISTFKTRIFSKLGVSNLIEMRNISFLKNW